MGYLGATHAACMAELGHEVLGVEVDEDKLAKFAAGTLPIYEPGLENLYRKHIESGQLRVTSSYQEAAEWGDVFFVAVGTPQKDGDHAADLQYVDSVIEALVPLLTRDAVILGKSTVPVGTAHRLADRADELAKDVTVEIAWNPEFLREGSAVADTLRPERLVVGVQQGGRAEAVTREIYAPLIAAGTPFLVTDPATSELVKVTANALLATKISFINAVAEVCAAAGADVKAVADAVGYDSRIGRSYLNPGLGYGGGCLPKDVRAFMARAGELGAADALTFLREVDAINMGRRARMVRLCREVCAGSLLGARVAVLGVAYKPDCDDVRDSPALNVAGQIQLQGAMVTAYDPKAVDNARAIFPTLRYAETAAKACDGADVVLVLTEWAEFLNLDPHAIGARVRRRAVIDGRMCLDKSHWTDAGWEYWI
jgi:UDPglucose 6-dehydrogenase